MCLIILSQFIKQKLTHIEENTENSIIIVKKLKHKFLSNEWIKQILKTVRTEILIHN